MLAVALVPLWFLIALVPGANSQTLFRATRVASARVIVHFVETMTGIRAVQAFRKESRNGEEYGGYVEDYRHGEHEGVQPVRDLRPGASC